MKENKVILVGAIRKGETPFCGETMKNQLFLRRFNELFDQVIPVDTLNWQKRPWCLVELFFVLLFNRDAKLIISASGAARKLLKALYYIPLNKNVYFWVVGGDLPVAVRGGKYNVNVLNNCKAILVQGRSMVKELNELGVNNAIYVPNSKPIEFVPMVKEKTDSVFKFVFLSRVHPDKGIKEIKEACDKLNESGYEDRYKVDFYGNIDPLYNDTYFETIKGNNNVCYKGFLNLLEGGYTVLSEYDVMLFPTYWHGEGFPGVVLDSYIAGLPIIASDWNLNKDVIKDKETGVIIPVKDSLALYSAMKSVIDGAFDLASMKRNCMEYVRQFDYREVLSEQLMIELKLIEK